MKLMSFLSLLLLSVSVWADAPRVQLPFYDGKAYQCTQNSGDPTSHNGVSTKYDLDFSMGVGDIVVAGAAGTMHRGSDPDGFGRYAKIDIGNDQWIMNGHLRDYIAQEGEQVYVGQPIAYSGNTGYVLPRPTPEHPASGQHIHYGVHEGSGVGTSVPMEVYALDRDGGSPRYFTVGSSSEFVCGLTSGHKYESRPIGKTFSDFSCKKLSGENGVLCWKDNPVDCIDGNSHVRYYKTDEGAFQTDSDSETWRWCYEDTGQSQDILAYLEGGHGIGGFGPGYQTDATDSLQPEPPDFVVNWTKLKTPWGKEVYKYGMKESIDTVAQSENIGDGACNGDVVGHFYLSKKYKEDPHSGDGAWRRLDSTNTHCSNLEPGETHTETKNTVIAEWIDEPGIYNIVYYIDHPYDDHNNGGDYPEKYESNNGSTEAVFEVTGNDYENFPDVNFTAHSFQFTQAPRYAGDFARFGVYVENNGSVSSPMGIRSSYSVECPGTGRMYLADDGTDADDLTPGKLNWEETLSAVLMPNVVGNCTAHFTVNYQRSVPETNVDDNETSFSFSLEPRPQSKLVIVKFSDDHGCCTTNLGKDIKPRIWVKNDGPVAPAENTVVQYSIANSLATGGQFILMGTGVIEPRELASGDTDEDHMDPEKWYIPKNSAWKKGGGHTVRACLNSQGGLPNANLVCATYWRYSKE